MRLAKCLGAPCTLLTPLFLMQSSSCTKKSLEHGYLEAAPLFFTEPNAGLKDAPTVMGKKQCSDPPSTLLKPSLQQLLSGLTQISCTDTTVQGDARLDTTLITTESALSGNSYKKYCGRHRCKSIRIYTSTSYVISHF